MYRQALVDLLGIGLGKHRLDPGFGITGSGLLVTRDTADRGLGRAALIVADFTITEAAAGAAAAGADTGTDADGLQIALVLDVLGG